MNLDKKIDNIPTKTDKNEPEARGGVTVVFFAAAIILHAFLVRNYILADLSRLSSIPLVFELIFHLLLVVGCVVCVRQKAGWKTPKGVALVFILFVLYTILNAAYYTSYVDAYLTGMDAVYTSTAGAMVGVKATLILIGIIAGIPSTAKIDRHEYARLLKQKVEMQNASYAKEAALNSKKDLEKTIENLRKSMSEEEFKELMSKFSEGDIKTEEGTSDAEL